MTVAFNANICVASLFKNNLSCEITTTQPENSKIASSNDLKVSTSKSLVGSSSNNTFPGIFKVLAK